MISARICLNVSIMMRYESSIFATVPVGWYLGRCAGVLTMMMTPPAAPARQPALSAFCFAFPRTMHVHSVHILYPISSDAMQVRMRERRRMWVCECVCECMFDRCGEGGTCEVRGLSPRSTNSQNTIIRVHRPYSITLSHCVLHPNFHHPLRINR